MSWILGFLYGVTVLWIASLWAAVVGTIGVLPFAVIPRGRREKFTIVAGALWCDSVVRGFLFARPTVTGHVDVRDRQGVLVMCNHRSWVDPLLLITWTHSQGLSKAAIRYIPFVGFFAHLTGAVFFNRNSGKARKQAREDVMWLVKQGARVHVFPEGTRSRDGNLRAKVHLVLPRDCWEAGVPVVPCAVWGTERVLPTIFPSAFPFQRCRLDIGTTLYPKDFPDADAFANACWADVVRRVEALKSEEGPAR
jgi:1-acyl-sn-glycerol-3-phosphate acyltransferase